MYSAGLCPDRLDKCWKYSGLRGLLCSKPRAHDAGWAGDLDHVFTTKPDGQRCIVARLGMVWGYFTSDVDARLIGWSLPPSVPALPEGQCVGAVLDAELVAGKKPLFIDMLQDDAGLPVPTDRTIGQTLEAAKVLPFVECAVSFREYFSTYGEAEAYASQVPYPCDGMVAISVRGVKMKKLKNHRSVELKHLGNGQMASHEGTVILQHASLSRFSVDSIVELRFSAEVLGLAGSSSLRITCKDVFERTDKTKANSTEVCTQIFRVATGVVLAPTMVRRLCMLWCNSIKSKSIQKAIQSSRSRRVIVDVGLGDGQCLGLYHEALGDVWTKSVAFIEVDPSKATALAKALRTKRCRLIQGLSELLKSMSRLRNGDLDAVLCVADANNIGKHELLLQEMARTVGSVVSNFSASHVLPCIEMMLLASLKVFGCAYMYDTALPDGTLVDTGDIVMRKITREKATVKWGGDNIYDERPLYVGDLECYCSVRSALAVVPLSAEAAGSSIMCARHYKAVRLSMGLAYKAKF
ncbi:hypothetical protein PtB15_5B4 [Puccinia triticina]|nr:hypothetical protein PtB15_5B4 [Puccinia triticina]